MSRNPVQSGVLIAGLTTSVGARDELEIIVDRRRGTPGDPPSIERRHRLNVVRALERDGFAIVPMPAASRADRLGANLSRGSGVPPVDRIAPLGHIPSDEADEKKIERIIRFKHRRMVRLNRWLIISGLMNAILASMLLAPVVKNVVRQGRPFGPASSVVAPAVEPRESHEATR